MKEAGGVRGHSGREGRVKMAANATKPRPGELTKANADGPGRCAWGRRSNSRAAPVSRGRKARMQVQVVRGQAGKWAVAVDRWEEPRGRGSVWRGPTSELCALLRLSIYTVSHAAPATHCYHYATPQTRSPQERSRFRKEEAIYGRDPDFSFHSFRSPWNPSIGRIGDLSARTIRTCSQSNRRDTS
jgi:hypothetical protein